jgi:hypothetical protein
MHQLGPKGIKRAENMNLIVEFLVGRGHDNDSSSSGEGSKTKEDDSDCEESARKDVESGDDKKDSKNNDSND